MNRKDVSARTLKSILMVGYNGANNTGAEALLHADIQDLSAALGPEARITVPTLNEASLRRYLTAFISRRLGSSHPAEHGGTPWVV